MLSRALGRLSRGGEVRATVPDKELIRGEIPKISEITEADCCVSHREGKSPERPIDPTERRVEPNGANKNQWLISRRFFRTESELFEKRIKIEWLPPGPLFLPRDVPPGVVVLG